MMEQLYSKLVAAGLIDDMGYIILERYENGTYQAIDKQTFETFFGDVAGKPTHKALTGTHTFKWGEAEQTATAADLGFKTYFDAWKEQGIL